MRYTPREVRSRRSRRARRRRLIADNHNSTEEILDSDGQQEPRCCAFLRFDLRES